MSSMYQNDNQQSFQYDQNQESKLLQQFEGNQSNNNTLSKNPKKVNKLTPQQIAKSNNLRGLINIKSVMDKRKQQRSLAVYYLINTKYQSALIVGRQLMFSSLKVWKQFNDEFKKQFQEQFFFRTSKVREHVEYLLDSVILCKIFIAGKKRQDAVDILQKLQIPDAPIVHKKTIKSDEDRLLFNQAHQIYSKTCGVLLNLIEIAKGQRLHDYTEKLFTKYLTFIKKYYGEIQYGTALFRHANYLYESKLYEQAEKQYQKCIQIRKRNVYNGGLIDALVNSAICLKETCRYDLSIQRIKMAIQITQDIFIDGSDEIDDYYLFLGKLYFEMGEFKNSYHYFLHSFKLREGFDKGHPKKVETQLNFIFLYKTLQDLVKAPSQILNLTEKKEIQQKKVQAQETIQIIQNTILQRQDFAKYKEFKSSKMAHLTLQIGQQFFELLSSEQINQLNLLKARLLELTFMRGLNQLVKATFYEDKKTRDLLLEQNPLIKSARGFNKLNTHHQN